MTSTPTRLIRCPKCKAQLKAPAAAAKIRCPKCAAVLKLPGAAPAPPLPPPPADEPLLSFEGETTPEPLPEVPPGLPPEEPEPLPEIPPEPEPATDLPPKPQPEAPSEDLEPLPELPETPEPAVPEPSLEEEPEVPSVSAEDYPTKAEALLAAPRTVEKRPTRRPAPVAPRAAQLPWRWEAAPAAAPRSLGLLLIAGALLAGAATTVALGFLKPEWVAWIGERVSHGTGQPAPPATTPPVQPEAAGAPIPEAPPPAEETSPPPTPGGTP